VFEFKRCERSAFVTAEAGKGDDRTDTGNALGQQTDFGLQVEIRALNTDRRGGR
jgi:hypothetical protein